MNETDYSLTLLRHGESEGNAQSVIQGQKDFPLTEKGRLQVRALAERWLRENRRFDMILASPLLRARETAEILGAALDSKIVIDQVWMERDFGRMSGDPIGNLPEAYPNKPFRHPYQPMGDTGESDLDIFIRGGQALQTILQQLPGHYLVAAHSGILNMVLYAILGIAPMPNLMGPRFNFRNAAFTSVSYNPGGHHWRVFGIDDQRHWEAAEVSTNG
jgi:broad specificity phosphatase PhoE